MRIKSLSAIHQTGLEAAGSAEERAMLRHALRKRIQRMVAKYRDSPVLKKFMTTLKNACDNLFWYVLDPRISSTNNAAGRGVREWVVHRKIRGSIRAEETMTALGNLFTCVTTWRTLGLDFLAEIRKYL